MFNAEFMAKIAADYQCQQFVVSLDGQVYALKPEGQHLIPGLVLDTDTADGTVALAAIEKAAG